MDLSLAIALGVTLVIAILLIAFNNVSKDKMNYQKYLKTIFFEIDYIPDKSELQHRLSLLKLDKNARQIENKVIDMLKFVPQTATDTGAEVGCSKMGGYGDTNFGKPLSNNSFLMQINCKEIKNIVTSPSEGMLYFFVDTEKMLKEKKNFVEVQYVSDLSDLQECSMQNRLYEQVSVLHFTAALSLPDPYSLWAKETFTDMEQEGYYKLINTDNANQIGGYPQSITQHFDFNPDTHLLLLQVECMESSLKNMPKWARIYVFADKEKVQANDFTSLTSYLQYFDE
ncbi:MAG: DUF1963 domain-containing protein [Bacteroidales bacterium]|nr:DUF1963 domain-containing protein [Bacteroidales bacterium]